MYVNGAGTVTGNITNPLNGNTDTGGNLMLGVTTNSTDKYSAIVSQHYSSTAETEGYTIIGSRALSGGNYVYIGGGHSQQNAATNIRFFVGSTSTTRTGTEEMRIANNAVFIYNLPTSDPTAAGQLWSDSGTVKVSAG